MVWWCVALMWLVRYAILPFLLRWDLIICAPTFVMDAKVCLCVYCNVCTSFLPAFQSYKTHTFTIFHFSFFIFFCSCSNWNRLQRWALRLWTHIHSRTANQLEMDPFVCPLLLGSSPSSKLVWLHIFLYIPALPHTHSRCSYIQWAWINGIASALFYLIRFICRSILFQIVLYSIFICLSVLCSFHACCTWYLRWCVLVFFPRYCCCCSWWMLSWGLTKYGPLFMCVRESVYIRCMLIRTNNLSMWAKRVAYHHDRHPLPASRH